MEPLQAIPMPTHGAQAGLTTENSWSAEAGEATLLLAYIATNSTQPVSFVSLQSATRMSDVLRLASRPSQFDDMPYGFVVEVYLARPLGQGEAVFVSVAQAGATTYYPPQPIDDTK